MNLGPCFLPLSRNDVPVVAIAVGRSQPNSGEYFHAAILFRDSKKLVQSLDFGLDGAIAPAEADFLDRVAWAVPQLNLRILRQIAGFCEAIAKSPPRFLYDFELNAKVILKEKATGFYLAGETHGFTCSTFVLAIFQSKGFPLVKLDDWVLRPEDKNWQASLLKILRNNAKYYGVTDGYLAKLEQKMNDGCLRYTPADAIGACRVGSHPTPCDPTKAAGAEVVRWVNESHGIAD